MVIVILGNSMTLKDTVAQIIQYLYTRDTFKEFIISEEGEKTFEIYRNSLAIKKSSWKVKRRKVDYNKYKPQCKTYCARMTQADDASCSDELDCDCMPDWILTGVEDFEALAEATKREGFVISIDLPTRDHYNLEGDESIDELITKVKEILIKEKVIDGTQIKL